MIDEDDLRRAFERGARTADPSQDAWVEIERRYEPAPGPTGFHRATVVFVAAVIGAAAVVLAVRALSPAPHPPAVARTHIAPPPAGTVRTIDLGWDPKQVGQGIAALDGYTWVAASQNSTLIGPDGSLKPISLEQGPFDVSASSSSIWATGYEPGIGNYVARYEPGSATADLSVPLNIRLPSFVCATDTGVWVLGTERGDASGSTSNVLLRIDPADGSVVKIIALRDVLPAGLANGITYSASADETAVWLVVAEFRHGPGSLLGPTRLVRIDATTYQATTYDAGSATAVVAGDGAAWLPGANGPVRLDPQSGTTSDLGIPDREAVPLVITADAAWFIAGTPSDVQIVRLDLRGQEPHVEVVADLHRQPSWGTVSGAFDEAGWISLLYENGLVQQVSVRP